MSKKRRQHCPDPKVKVGLEALKGVEPVHSIAARYEVHPVQVRQWKREAAERLPEVFARQGSQIYDAEASEGTGEGAGRGDWTAEDGAGEAQESWRARALRSIAA